MITSHASRMKTELMHVNEVPDPLSLVNRGQWGKPCCLFCLPGIDGKKQWRLKAGNRSKTRTLASSISSLRNPLERQQANYLTTNMRAYNAAAVCVVVWRWDLSPRQESLLPAERIWQQWSQIRSKLSAHWRGCYLQHKDACPHASTLRVMPGSLSALVCWYGHILRVSPRHYSRVVHDINPVASVWKRTRVTPNTLSI